MQFSVLNGTPSDNVKVTVGCTAGECTGSDTPHAIHKRPTRSEQMQLSICMQMIQQFTELVTQ